MTNVIFFLFFLMKASLTQIVGQLRQLDSPHLEVFVIVKDPPIKAIDPGVAGVGRVVDHRRAA